VKALGNDDRTFRDKPFGTAGGVLKPKDLVMMPARVALALQADGWWLRSEIIWAKPNPMPESTTDRPTSAHEKLYLLSKSARYYYDAEAVRETAEFGRSEGTNWSRVRKAAPGDMRNTPATTIRGGDGTAGRNLRNVWHIATEPYPEAHFATFPTKLVEPCIKAGTSEKGCCPECGAPWVREVEQSVMFQSGSGRAGNKPRGKHAGKEQSDSGTYDIRMGPVKESRTTGWRPSCECGGEPIPATVLDPFGGAGSTGLVADRLGRNAILIEAKPEYADMARKRIADDAGMFAEVGS